MQAAELGSTGSARASELDGYSVPTNKTVPNEVLTPSRQRTP